MTTQEILDGLAAVGAARRGQITEQWYAVKGADGRERRQGPYYVWTRYDDGKKLTSRVSREETERAFGEIGRGREMGRLIGELWRNAETLAEGAQKKTAGAAKSKPARGCGRPSRSSAGKCPPGKPTSRGSRRR